MQIPGKYADWQQDAPPIFPTSWRKYSHAACCHLAFYQTLHKQGGAAKQRISSFKGSI
jgi:hypothetical protein